MRAVSVSASELGRRERNWAGENFHGPTTWTIACVARRMVLFDGWEDITPECMSRTSRRRKPAAPPPSRNTTPRTPCDAVGRTGDATGRRSQDPGAQRLVRARCIGLRVALGEGRRVRSLLNGSCPKAFAAGGRAHGDFGISHKKSDRGGPKDFATAPRRALASAYFAQLRPKTPLGIHARLAGALRASHTKPFPQMPR